MSERLFIPASLHSVSSAGLFFQDNMFEPNGHITQIHGGLGIYFWQAPVSLNSDLCSIGSLAANARNKGGYIDDSVMFMCG